MAKPTQSVYRTARGAQLDMLKLINQNEMTIAVGNAKVNARGDKLGPGGAVVQPRNPAKPPLPEQPKVETAQQKTKDIEDMDPEGDE